jgi:hypothetical protein
LPLSALCQPVSSSRLALSLSCFIKSDTISVWPKKLCRFQSGTTVVTLLIHIDPVGFQQIENNVTCGHSSLPICSAV